MNAPFTFGKFSLNGRSIAVAIAVAILLPISPHEASAKGGTYLWSHLSPVSRAEAKTEISSRPEATPLTIRGCGGKRHRDPNTHRCRGPADVGN